MIYQKNTKRIIFNSLLLAFIVVGHFVSPASVYAQGATNSVPTNTATQSTDPLKPNYVKPPAMYSGVESSIGRFLCIPGSQTSAGTNATVPTIDTGTSTERAASNPDAQDLPKCINKLYRFGAAIGAFAAVFFIALSGYLYIVGGESGKQTAKKYILSVIAGLVIIFTSYILLRQINPSLVVFRTIQPPQLVGVKANYPACEDIGFGVDCVVAGGEDTPGSTGQVLSSGGGLAVACTEGLASIASYDVPTKDGRNLQICKSLGPKLKAAYEASKDQKWRATATIDPGHSSRCHKPGNPENGNCVDIGTGDGDRAIARWDAICAAFKKQGGVSIANEIAPKSASGAALQAYTTPNCGPAKDKSTAVYKNASDAPSIHVNYTGK